MLLLNKISFYSNKIFILLFFFLQFNCFAIDPILELTPNEVFFTPVGTLRNVALSGVTGTAENQNKFYSYTSNWHNLTDTLVWGIDVVTPGTLSVTAYLGVPSSQEGSVIELIMNGQKQQVTLKGTGDYSVYGEQDPVTFTIAQVGRYSLNMKINSIIGTGNIADVKKLVLSGTAAKDIKPVILRWRPSAVHCGFKNSTNPANVILAVHEVTIHSTNEYSYSPIITPFGYYGSTWDNKKQQFGGVNFSLWSFAAGENPPPTEEFSHLIAVGKGLFIDGFNHEGTGSKARGDNPFDKMNGNTQVLAVKKVPGNPYDVYYSYYWETNLRKWLLYGCGKKYNNSSLKYLTTGAFVEVPGAAETQRSNNVKRDVRFKGWLMNENNEWFPMDQMNPSGSLESNSYKNWGIDNENRFFMQMGGFDPLLTTKPGTFTVTELSNTFPEYLSPENMADLSRLPATINMVPASNITNNSAKVSFTLDAAGTNAKATLYWGETDGLTFVEGNKGNGGLVKWDNHIEVPISETGLVEYNLSNLELDTKYFYRLQLINDEGETWSFDTQNFTTSIPEDLISVDFTTDKTDIQAGESVTFTNKSKGNNVTFEWTFEGGIPATSTEINPAVTYNTEGLYDVSLTVTDEKNNQNSKTVSDHIVVTQMHPEVNLEVYYNFRKNMIDLSDHGRDGNTSAPLNYVLDPEKGWVADFDGNNPVTVNGYNGVLGTDARSVTVWVKTSVTGKVITTWGKASTSNKWTLKTHSNGSLRLEIAGGYIYGTSTITDGQWHHVACVFEDDGSPEVQDILLYVDGILEKTTANIKAINTIVDKNILIGNDVFGAKFIGQMSDLKIFSKSLTPAEITQMANVIARSKETILYLDEEGKAELDPALLDNGSTTPFTTLSFSVNKSSFSCSDLGNNTVQLTATDNTNRKATCDATVIVEDKISPVLLLKDIVVYLDADGKATVNADQINNGSFDNCGISISLDKTSFTCEDKGEQEIAVIASDPSNNTIIGTAKVTIVDNLAPQAICKNIEVPLDESGKVIIQASLLDAGSKDNCSSILTLAIDKDQFGCSDLGSHEVVLTVTDESGNSSTNTSLVTVNLRTSSLIFTSANSGNYSDPASLRVRLTDDITGNGIEGKTISFTYNGQLLSGITDNNGIASVSLTLSQAPGEYDISARVEEACPYKGSSINSTFTVYEEDACAIYSGVEMASTRSVNSKTAMVLMAATVIEGDSNTPGDLTKAMVQFYSNNTPLGSPVQVRYANTANGLIGVAYLEWPFTINSSAETFEISAQILGYYSSIGDCIGSANVTVYTPQSDFITGGGDITPENPAGLNVNDFSSINFGFEVKYNKQMTELQGNFNSIIRRTEDGKTNNYHIKSDSFSSITVNQNKAVFTGKATIKGNNSNQMTTAGIYTFQITLTDNDDNGTDDYISIVIWDENGGLWFCNNWDNLAQKPAEQLISKGNLVIHSSTSTNSPNAYNKSATLIDCISREPQCKVWPNPFSDRLLLEFSSKEDTHATLEIYDVRGIKLSTIFKQNIKENQSYRTEYIPENNSSQLIFYKLIVGDKVFTGKCVYQGK